MRIAYLSTFYPYRGGIAQFNASLYREFEKNYEIKAFTFTRQYPNLLFPGKTQYVTADETADPIPATRTLDTINPFTWLRTVRAINQYAPDLLIMKYWMSFFGPSLGTVAKFMKPKTTVITILDNVIPHEKKIIDIPFTKYFLKHGDGFVAMSNAVKNDLLTLKPNANVILKEHPLYNHFGDKLSRNEACRKLKLPEKGKNILFFGFIRDYKGLDLLIDAFGKMGEEYNLIIAGEPYGSFEKYTEQINRLSNKNNVYVYTDYIADHQVPAFFSASDVCVLPYKSATQSGITSISYHFNVPLIATDTGGLKESIHHNQTGLIVDEISSQALLKSLNQYFENNLQTRFTEGIEKIKTELSWENFGNSLISFSKSL